MKENNRNLYFVIANEKNEAYEVLVPHTINANKNKYNLSDILSPTETFIYSSENKEDCEKYIDDNGFKNYKVVDSFSEGYNLLDKKEEYVVLIANDLLDIYLEYSVTNTSSNLSDIVLSKYSDNLS